MVVEQEIDTVVVDAQRLEDFVVRVLTTLGMTAQNAKETAEVLIKADITGVDSHGVPRLPNYVARIKAGTVKPNPEVRVVHELASTALVDGGNGIGMVVGRRAMAIAIQKAQATGAGFVSVRNSSHYGIAGYYARMALPHNMIGISMTNVGAGGGTPATYGRTGLFGTNPIAVAAPTRKDPPFVMDFATTVVAFGKLQIAMRRGQKVPLGWVMDREGNLTDNPNTRADGGYMLPLGGLKETGGHKGYGLMLLVDILTAALSGAAFGATFAKPNEATRATGSAANTGHFFGAFRIDGFRPLEEFLDAMDEMYQVIHSSEKLPGHDRIYVHGEIDWETEAHRRVHGIPLDIPTYKGLEAVSKDMGVPLDIKK
ncbi:MAG: Ldh family oxidoreductase [Chloroflexi bacterium]|nr:Ldh family oxidoreductase [Chloroflexota bacterium]